MKTNTGRIVQEYKGELFLVFLIMVAIIYAYMPIWPWLHERYEGVDTMYSHGYIVPFASLLMVYMRRDKLQGLKLEPSLVGLLPLSLGLMMHVGALIFDINFISGFSLLLVVAGIVLLLLGKQYFRALLFPIIYLGFAIPAPHVFIMGLAFRMKIKAAQVAALLCRKVLHMPVVQVGSFIRWSGDQLIVGTECSGLRSLIAILALGFLAAYIFEAPLWKRTLLILLSIPIALIANVVRIMILTIGAYLYGSQKVLHGFFHDFAGYMVWIVSVGLMLVLWRLLSWRKDSSGTE